MRKSMGVATPGHNESKIGDKIVKELAKSASHVP